MSDRLTRRQALAIGAVGAGALVVGATGAVVAGRLAPRTGGDSTPAEGGASSGFREPSVVTSAAGVLELDLPVAARSVTLRGEPVRMLTYAGTVPGPTLHVRPGDRLRIHLRNELEVPTNLHTHGLLVSARGNSDNPFLRIGPGERFDYEIDLPADHPAGVFWYHPHHHGMVADQLFAGLYGAIAVDEDDWETAPPRMVVISDVTIASGAVTPVSQPDRMLGRTGQLLLVNGQVAPVLTAPPGSEQRLLVVNACASRYLDLGLTGLDATVRGIDSGHLLRAADRLLLMPGNRADLVIRTPRSGVDVVARAYDRGAAGGGMMGGRSAVSPEALVLTVAPDPGGSAIAIAPPVAETHPDLLAAPVRAHRTVTLSMGMGAGAGMRFLIDGRAFSPDRVDLEVALGDVEEWTIVNASPMAHPFHLHVWPMQLVRRGTAAVSGIDVRDVVDVPPRSSVRVRIAFDRFPGRTVYHCHILDHEDLGMMGVIESA
ncbi:multicopper oxidase family protein [Amnibacterium sp.]|uniref:multicopper oxidase family protein n=1 Tax=Amnibacterium sp. TaxID=1872496 RepID=UPI003F7C1B02